MATVALSSFIEKILSISEVFFRENRGGELIEANGRKEGRYTANWYLCLC